MSLPPDDSFEATQPAPLSGSGGAHKGHRRRFAWLPAVFALSWLVEVERGRAAVAPAGVKEAWNAGGMTELGSRAQHSQLVSYSYSYSYTKALFCTNHSHKSRE